MKRNFILTLIISILFLTVLHSPSHALFPMHPDEVTRLKAEGEYDAFIQQWFDYTAANPEIYYDPEELILIADKIEQIEEVLRSDYIPSRSQIDLDGNGVTDERDFLELGFPVARRGQSYTAPSIGEQKSIVILVEFNDLHGDPSHGTSYFNEMLFGVDVKPNPSMRDFYTENSNHLLDCIGTVADSGVNGGWFRINKNASRYYGFNNAPDLVNKAIDLADPYIDFSEFDNGGDGKVESLMVIAAGPAGGSTFWPHKWNLWEPRTVDGVSVYPYFLATEDSQMGTFAHEHGHAMGLPDLYDYDGSSWGVGYWCCMSYGCWGCGDSVVPVNMSAWCKYTLGWMNPVNIEKDYINAPILGGDIDRVFRLWSYGQMGTEYFLIENRRLDDTYDCCLPGEGVLIWHVDHWGDQQNDSRRIVDLEEADGRDDIDTLANGGDDTDPYYAESGNNRFSDHTYPWAYDNSGYPTGIIVSSISEQGETMYANLLNNPYGVDGLVTEEPDYIDPNPE